MSNITGTVSEQSRIIVVDSTLMTTEKTEVVSAGSYNISGLTEGEKIILSRSDSGEVLGYSGVVPVTLYYIGDPVSLDGTDLSSGCCLAYDSVLNRFACIYYNSTDDYVKRIAFKCDDDTITFGGDPVNQKYGTGVASQSTKLVYSPYNEKLVFFYGISTGTIRGYGVVGYINGSDVITTGPETTTSVDGAGFVSTVFDTLYNRVVVFYREGGSSATCYRIGNISDTTISYGSETVFETVNSGHMTVGYDSNLKKVAVFYKASDNSFKAKIGQVNNYVITFDQSAVAVDTGLDYIPSVVFDTNSNKLVVIYVLSSNLYAKVGTVNSETNTISFGSSVLIASGAFAMATATFDSVSNKVVVNYTDSATTKNKAIAGSVSGDSISFGETFSLFDDATNCYPSSIAYSPVYDRSVVAATVSNVAKLALIKI